MKTTTKRAAKRISYTWSGVQHTASYNPGRDCHPTVAVARAIGRLTQSSVELLNEHPEAGEFRAVYHNGERYQHDVVIIPVAA